MGKCVPTMSVARLESTRPPAPVFTGMPLDRAQTGRGDPAWVERQVHDPASRVLAASSDGVLLDPAGEAVLRAAVPIDGEEPILLGLEDGRALFALDLEGLDAERAEHVKASRASLVTLREAGATLPQAEGGLAAYVVAMLNWHRRHRFCANCGSRTHVMEAGYSRHCPNCGATHFPRTDPVVIMLIEHDDRILLGGRVGRPSRRLSVLAGFVSPGESAEEAVVREVLEESGIVAYDPEFVASQPWPFPASLMLGFTARAHGGEPVARDGELEEVGWFTREQVLAAARDGEEEGGFALPPHVSIARLLIDRWLGES